MSKGRKEINWAHRLNRLRCCRLRFQCQLLNVQLTVLWTASEANIDFDCVFRSANPLSIPSLSGPYFYQGSPYFCACDVIVRLIVKNLWWKILRAFTPHRLSAVVALQAGPVLRLYLFSHEIIRRNENDQVWYFEVLYFDRVTIFCINFRVGGRVQIPFCRK